MKIFWFLIAPVLTGASLAVSGVSVVDNTTLFLLIDIPACLLFVAIGYATESDP